MVIYHLTSHEFVFAEAIIDALDESGYLTISLEETAHCIDHKNPPSINALAPILECIKKCDPAGIGASNLQACLLMQLNAMQIQDPILDLSKK